MSDSQSTKHISIAQNYEKMLFEYKEMGKKLDHLKRILYNHGDIDNAVIKVDWIHNHDEPRLIDAICSYFKENGLDINDFENYLNNNDFYELEPVITHLNKSKKGK